MQVSPSTRQIEPKPYKQGAYFASGVTLYYIIAVDANDDNNHFYIENCYTNKARWWSLQEMMETRKRIVELEAA